MFEGIVAMSLKSDWHKHKKALEKAKLDTSIFKENLGDALENFESTRKKLDAARAETTRDEAKIEKRRTEFTTACDKAQKIGAKYEATVRHLADRATDPAVRDAASKAAAFLLTMMHQVQQSHRQASPTRRVPA